MKQCPTCGTTYTDETLRYCLADGGSLIDVGTDANRVARAGVRVDVPPPSYPTLPVAVEQASTKGSPVLKIVAALLILGFLGLLGLGTAGALFYMKSGKNNVAVVSPTPVSTPVPKVTPLASPSWSPTPDSDEERLEKELANLQRQLEEVLKPESSDSPARTESDGSPTARVNSPSDGFLALRSEPDAETGQRIAQIPHGTVVALENCEKEKVKIGSRTGRWCMVTYRSQTGWVFDAFLQY